MRGAEVRRVRKELGLTQREFAKRLGVTGNSVARWERNELTVGSTAAILIRLLGELHRKEHTR
jgi:transcriptional regulator with XRE-family HTH domain